ncbi:zinc finger BED domain-containing protein RICESLEEPER 2-like [Henckelia pumila]|uniref:zinc finger BED domain-containing protein RICESLEEPER 2-like n=1 Tax=Henckelia pumila TaxID=405737 RepID=UPI003C6E8A26
MESNVVQNSSQTSNETENETQQSTTGKRPRKPPKAPKQGKSIFWEHCIKGTRKLSNDTVQQIGICKYCKVEIPTVYGSTSGLKNHLVKRCKSSPLYEVSGDDKSQTTLMNETMGQGSVLVSHAFNKKKCELKLARYVIVDEMSFRVVEGKRFVELLHELQPRFRILDRKKIASMVYDLFLVEKAKIQSVIGDVRVTITTDTWTSIQNINYMVVTAHFVDSDWKLHKRILNFTKITNHSSEEIGKMVEVCLREWGIEKVFSIVVDNASSNDSAIDYLKRRMKGENLLLFEGKYLHLRCACHIINLIVKDGLKELNVSIKAIRNAVVFIHSSPSRLNKFREFSMLDKFSSTSTVPMDVKTRWNATYKMLEAALKYRKGKEKIGPPISDDWERAKAFVHFLKKFYDATLELSASKNPTSHLIYQSMISLQVEIDRKRHDDSYQILTEVASAMKSKFDKYWGNWNNMNPLIFIGNVLDPKNKLQMIKVTVRKLGGSAARMKYFADKVKQYLVTLWMEYKGINDILNVESQSMQIEGDGGDAGPGGDGVSLCDELFDDVEAQNEAEQLQ